MVVLGERYGVDEEGFMLKERGGGLHGERGAEVPEVARVVQLPLRMHYKGVGRRVGRRVGREGRERREAEKETRWPKVRGETQRRGEIWQRGTV